MRDLVAEALAAGTGGQSGDSAAFGPAQVAVVGVGRGRDTVARLSDRDPDGVKTVTDAAEATPARLAGAVGDADLVFLVCGLAGDTAAASGDDPSVTAADDPAVTPADDPSVTTADDTVAAVVDAAAADTPVVAFCRPPAHDDRDGEPPAHDGHGSPARARLAALTTAVDTTLLVDGDGDDGILATALASLAATVTQPSLVGLDYAALYEMFDAGGVGVAHLVTAPPDRRLSPVVAEATAPDDEATDSDGGATAPNDEATAPDDTPTRSTTDTPTTPLRPAALDPSDAAAGFVNLTAGPESTLRTAERVVATATRRLPARATTAWSADTRPSDSDHHRASDSKHTRASDSDRHRASDSKHTRASDSDRHRASDSKHTRASDSDRHRASDCDRLRVTCLYAGVVDPGDASDAGTDADAATDTRTHGR